MKKYGLLITALFIVTAYAGNALAQVGESWQRQFPVMHTYNGMTTAAGISVSVGNNGEISTSADGINWTARNSWTTEPLYDVAGTAGKYVAVGANGTILFSQNGTSWINISQSITNLYTFLPPMVYGVTWGNGEFVAVGDRGAILVSSDGLNWAVRTTPASNVRLNSIVWNGALYVAVGEVSFSPVVFTSADGINWTQQTTTMTNSLFDIAWDGTSFVAVGDFGLIATSPDGVTWATQTSGTTWALSSVIWTGTQFVTVGAWGTILTSATGTAWTPQTSPVNEDIQAITMAGTLMLAGTVDGSLFSSSNGTAWSGAGSFYFETCSDIAWNQTNTYVAVCGNAVFLSSTDTYSWTKVKPAGYGWVDVLVWDGAQFVVSGGNFLYTGTNGTTWAQSNPGAPFTQMKSITWDGAQYLASGFSEMILTSTNLTAWTQQNSNLNGGALDEIIQGGGIRVAYGYTGTILTSVDGVSWTPSVASGVYYGITAMTWDGAQFVAFASGSVITSTDGNVWSSQADNLYALAGNARVNRIVYNGTQYLAVGNFGKVFTSADGLNWVTRQSGSAMNITDVLWDGTQYVASAEAETILVSRDNGALPVISLNGLSSEIVPLEVPYVDSGATASDAEDGNLTASILTAGSVDIYTLGTYMLDYAVVDSNGNVASAVRTVIVADQTPPVVTAPPAITMEATSSMMFVTLDPGGVATAMDNVDGVLTPWPDMTVFGVGVNTVTWSSTDNAGNTGTVTQTVTITDTTAPTITISGGDLTLPQGSSAIFISSGVTASDIVDGNLTGSVVQSGVVNLNVPGTYTATFTVTDNAGNSASASRNITVVGAGGNTGTSPASSSPAPTAGGGGGGCVTQQSGRFEPLLVILLLLAGIRLARKKQLRV